MGGESRLDLAGRDRRWGEIESSGPQCSEIPLRSISLTGFALWKCESSEGLLCKHNGPSEFSHFRTAHCLRGHYTPPPLILQDCAVNFFGGDLTDWEFCVDIFHNLLAGASILCYNGWYNLNYSVSIFCNGICI